MIRNTLSLQDRVQKAAEVLYPVEFDHESNVPLKSDTGFKLKEALACLGIEIGDEFSEKIIDAETTTEEMIRDKILDFFGRSVDKAPKPARLAAACAILKGRDPFKKDEVVTPMPVAGVGLAPNVTVFKPDSTVSSGAELVVKHLEALRPVSQLKDRELLEKYVQERDFDTERELDLRAKGQPFIVLENGSKKEPGKEVIDIAESLELLKRARKGRVNNTIIAYGDKVANVYRITELNMDDRKTELCPICGAALYKGYCEECELNFQPVGMDARAYMKLVVDSGKFQKDSYADRKALHVSAMKGLDDLKVTWPSLSKEFDELKETNDLPRLVTIEPRPSRRMADPFHVSGNRSY